MPDQKPTLEYGKTPPDRKRGRRGVLIGVVIGSLLGFVPYVIFVRLVARVEVMPTNMIAAALMAIVCGAAGGYIGRVFGLRK